MKNFHETTAQRHKRQSDLVAVAVKRDFKKGNKKRNFSVCGIPGHFAKDCRRKETAQCSKCGEKCQLDKACTRQKEGGKHECYGSSFGFTRQGTLWKTAGMLTDSCCTDHIVTNIDAFLGFVPIHLLNRNPNGEASRVLGRGCVRISIPTNNRRIIMRSQVCFVCA